MFLVARTAEPMEELKKMYPGQVEYLAGDLKDFEVSFDVIFSPMGVCRMDL